MAGPRQVNVNLSQQHYDQLVRMAADAGVKMATMAKRLLESLIDDDAKAHETKKSES